MMATAFAFAFAVWQRSHQAVLKVFRHSGGLGGVDDLRQSIFTSAKIDRGAKHSPVRAPLVLGVLPPMQPGTRHTFSFHMKSDRKNSDVVSARILSTSMRMLDIGIVVDALHIMRFAIT